jgi:hypothetical protein
MTQSQNQTFGKSIRVFLTNGTVNGIITSELVNWTGKLMVASRTDLSNLLSRPETQQTGIYFLVGEDVATGNLKAYVGESDNVIKRLQQHSADPEKDFWNQTILVINKDENLTKSHVRYLESRFIDAIKSAGKAILHNSTNPPLPGLPESDRSDMEYFMEQVRLLLPVLGFNFAQEPPKVTVLPNLVQITSNTGVTSPLIFTGQDGISPEFHLAVPGTNGIEAIAQDIQGSFVVKIGSYARDKIFGTVGSGYAQLREQLIITGKLVLDISVGLYIFTDNVTFNSPSAGAVIVAGTPRNGRKDWKTADGSLSYGDWQANLSARPVTISSGNNLISNGVDEDDN